MDKSKKLTNRHRYFSKEFKEQIIQQLDAKLLTVSDIARQYEVSSTSIYSWMRQYSPHYQKATVVVVQMESEALKTKSLQERNAELERIIGQKQLSIDYLEKLIEIASGELKLDLKKNFSTQPSTILS